jgi:hypothetical protein
LEPEYDCQEGKSWNGWIVKKECKDSTIKVGEVCKVSEVTRIVKIKEIGKVGKVVR